MAVRRSEKKILLGKDKLPKSTGKVRKASSPVILGKTSLERRLKYSTDENFQFILKQEFPTEHIVFDELRVFVIKKIKEYQKDKSKIDKLTDHQKLSLKKLTIAYDLEIKIATF